MNCFTDENISREFPDLTSFYWRTLPGHSYRSGIPIFVLQIHTRPIFMTATLLHSP